MTQLFNHEPVYRTAPATPGLLKTYRYAEFTWDYVSEVTYWLYWEEG